MINKGPKHTPKKGPKNIKRTIQNRRRNKMKMWPLGFPEHYRIMINRSYKKDTSTNYQKKVQHPKSSMTWRQLGANTMPQPFPKLWNFYTKRCQKVAQICKKQNVPKHSPKHQKSCSCLGKCMCSQNPRFCNLGAKRYENWLKIWPDN